MSTAGRERIALNWRGSSGRVFSAIAPRRRSCRRSHGGTGFDVDLIRGRRAPSRARSISRRPHTLSAWDHSAHRTRRPASDAEGPDWIGWWRASAAISGRIMGFAWERSAGGLDNNRALEMRVPASTRCDSRGREGHVRELVQDNTPGKRRGLGSHENRISGGTSWYLFLDTSSIYRPRSSAFSHRLQRGADGRNRVRAHRHRLTVGSRRDALSGRSSIAWGQASFRSRRTCRWSRWRPRSRVSVRFRSGAILMA